MNLGPATEQVEHKKSTSELKEGVASIASILNKHGKGTLYFGALNNGDENVCGTIFDLVDAAELCILNNIRRRFVFTGARTRDEIPEIPRKIIREALLNAYAHRLWTRPSYGIRVRRGTVKMFVRFRPSPYEPSA